MPSRAVKIRERLEDEACSRGLMIDCSIDPGLASLTMEMCAREIYAGGGGDEERFQRRDWQGAGQRVLAIVDLSRPHQTLTRRHQRLWTRQVREQPARRRRAGNENGCGGRGSAEAGRARAVQRTR